MDFVVNEWLPEYFRPDALPSEKEQLQVFLKKFYLSKDKIVVLKPSEFLRKIYNYAKAYQSNQKVYENIYLFITLILLNSEKCLLIEEVVDLPSTTSLLLDQGNFNSDRYLFQAASHTNSRLIVTVDERLILQLQEDNNFTLQTLSDFLQHY